MSTHRPSPRVLKALDALVYGLALTAVAATIGIAVGLLRGSVGTVVYVLFWGGFLLLGLGSWKLRPKAAWKEESRLNVQDSRRETAFQRAVQRVPPLNRYDIDPEERLSDGAKFLVGSAVMLATSFLLSVL